MELEEILLDEGEGVKDGQQQEIVFKISGITCDKCVRLITECLTDMDGVVQASVSRGE